MASVELYYGSCEYGPNLMAKFDDGAVGVAQLFDYDDLGTFYGTARQLDTIADTELLQTWLALADANGKFWFPFAPIDTPIEILGHGDPGQLVVVRDFYWSYVNDNYQQEFVGRGPAAGVCGLDGTARIARWRHKKHGTHGLWSW